MFSILIYDFELSQNSKILSFLTDTTYPLLLFIGKISLKLPIQAIIHLVLCSYSWYISSIYWLGLVRLNILYIAPKTLKMLSTKILRLVNFDVLFSKMYITTSNMLFFRRMGKYFGEKILFSRNVLQCDFSRDIIAKSNGF